MADFVAEPAQSTTLAYGDASTAVTVSVNNLLTVMPPNQAVRVIPANTLASTLDTFVVSSVQAAGELTFSCHHQAAQTSALRVVRDAKAAKWWEVGLGDTTGTIVFQGYLLDVELDITGGPESIPTVNCKVQVTTDEVFTAGS